MPSNSDPTLRPNPESLVTRKKRLPGGGNRDNLRGWRGKELIALPSREGAGPMTDVNLSHPTAAQLTEFGLNRLGKEAAAGIRSHLFHCATCRNALSDLVPNLFGRA